MNVYFEHTKMTILENGRTCFILITGTSENGQRQEKNKNKKTKKKKNRKKNFKIKSL